MVLDASLRTPHVVDAAVTSPVGDTAVRGVARSREGAERLHVPIPALPRYRREQCIRDEGGMTGVTDQPMLFNAEV